MPNRADDRERLKAAARRANQVPAVRWLARGGLVANGLVHVLIGAIAIGVAAGANAHPSQSGALMAVAETPGGVIVLWIAAIALFGLAFWQFTDAAWVTALKERTRIMRRTTDIAKALGFAVVGVVTLFFALGGRTQEDRTPKLLSSTLLESPGGETIMVVVAIVIGGIGVAHLLRGLRRRFRDELVPLHGLARGIVFTLGVVGHLAKAVAFLIVGGLIVYAALFHKPERAAGLDAALKYLATFPAGTVLLILIAVGLIGYGLYLFARGRYMRLGGG